MQRLHVEAEQVTNVEREKTKRVVYAVVYGVGELLVMHCVMNVRKLNFNRER